MRSFTLPLTLATICSFAASTARAQESESIPKFTITTVAGTGERGFAGDGGLAVEALIQRPTAVAVDTSGNLYIADKQNYRIRKVTPEGIITTVMGTGRTKVQYEDLPAIETNLTSAYGIAIDLNDNLYVLSRGHNKIFILGEDGIAEQIIGSGTRGFAGDGELAIEAEINFSNHLVVDFEGNLFLADSGNQRIRRISTEGIITTVAGMGQRGFSGDGGLAVNAELDGPSAIAIDREGNLYIADFDNHRIRKVTTDGIITSIAGTGVRGHTGDGGPAEEAQISNPDIVALDLEGNLFIPDHINAVVRKLTRVRD